MQALVYIFISLAGLAIAAAAYFGLTFTPIEALLAGLVAITLATVALERSLRRRAEFRLEKGVEDLSRLLSTDAQAGQVLSQRVNELADIEADKRLEIIEADVSVLGTVVRQVAEAVAELEEAKNQIAAQEAPPPAPVVEDDLLVVNADKSEEMGMNFPILLHDVRQALDGGRIVYNVQPIVTLPQRRVRTYTLLPCVELESGNYVNATDFAPQKGGDEVVQKIESLALAKAFAIARQARAIGDALSIHVPFSRATLSDPEAIEQTNVLLDANPATAKDISFAISERQWRGFNAMERSALLSVAEKGVGIFLADAKSLRLDFTELEKSGVTSIGADATRFINQPETYTDFHSSDVASYINRYGVELIVTGVRSEQQILSLLEDGVRLAQGNHIARPEPVPDDLAAGLIMRAPQRRASASR